MEIIMTVLGVILLIAAIFLVIAVLMQSSKSHKLSGTIAGGAETFFGKSKGATIDKKLNTLTAVIAVIFVVLVATMYVIQPNAESAEQSNVAGNVAGDVSDTSADTSADNAADDVADDVADDTADTVA